MKGGERDVLVIPELDALLEKDPKTTYPAEVDAALLEYGPKTSLTDLTWADITRVLNERFGLRRTSAAYRFRYYRLRDDV